MLGIYFMFIFLFHLPYFIYSLGANIHNVSFKVIYNITTIGDSVNKKGFLYSCYSYFRTEENALSLFFFL